MELPQLIEYIEQLNTELQGYMPLPAEIQEKLEKKFRLEFNYNSNHIEGNTLTYGETTLYLLFDQIAEGHSGREYEEMKGSDIALKMVQELAQDSERPLTEAFIKNLNKVILVRPYWTDAITQDGLPTRREITPGDYKKYPNSVRLQNGELFHYSTPQETPSSVSDMMEWFQQEEEKKELHPVALAALLHYRLVRIHPFDDGNGRISRLLMNYVLYKNNYPPVIIKSVNKKDYLLALNKADSGDLNAFAEYVAQQMIWSLELSLKAARGEEIEEVDDIDKEINIFKKQIKQNSRIVPKSAVAIRDLYSKSIQPFIQSFKSKIEQSFRELFVEWYYSECINNSQRGSDLIHTIMISRTDDEIKQIFSVSESISMTDSMTSPHNSFGVQITLEVLLNPTNYQVKVSTPLGTISYLNGGRTYNHLVSEAEQQQIIRETQKNILEYIKQKSEGN